MASSTTGSFYTSFANIRMPEGHYLILEFDYDYDDDGNPFVIEVRDGTGTEIENPDPNIIKEIIKEIPEFTGQPRAGLWFRNGVNSLSPIQNEQTDNIFLGFETAENFDLTDLVTYSGNYNFIAGYQLAPSLTTGSYNTIFGRDNYNNLSTQKYNTLFGSGNFTNITSGQFNLISGQNNGVNLTTSNYSTIFGFQNILTGSGTIYGSFINGLNNLNLATNISSSFVNGNSNGQNASTNFLQNFINGSSQLTNAQDIRFVFANGNTNGNGNNAPYTLWYSFFNGNNNAVNSNPSYAFFNGFGNLTLSNSTAYSFSNGFNNATSVTEAATHSFFSGDRNLFSATLSAGHTFMSGFQNAYNATGADFTTAIGYRNFYTSTSDIQYALAIGRENAYTNNVAHTGSIYLGYRNSYQGGGLYVNYQGWENGYYNTSNYNIAFGFQSLFGQSGLSTGSQNIAIGRQSLYNITTGSNNIGLAGYRAGFGNTTGGHNIYFGQETGYSNQSGNYNNYQGYQAGFNQTGSYNIGIGYRTLYGKSGLSTGGYNVALGGEFTGYDLTTGSYNVLLNRYAGQNLTDGNYNVMIGERAGSFNTNANELIYIGRESGQQVTGDYNIGIGFRATRALSGTQNIGIGQNALANTSSIGTGYLNIGIGSRALYSVTDGYHNIALGSSALDFNTTGYHNIALGQGALYNNTTGNYNIVLGRNAGYLSTGSSNVFIGDQSGYNETGSNKLYIENSNISTPLIYGEFDNDWIRINGYLEVRDKTGITTGNVVVWDGDKLVDSGSAIGSLGGDPDQTLTWTNTSTTVRNLTISGTGNTVELDGLAVEMALDDIVLNTSWRYQALDVNGVVLGAPLIIQEGTDINIVRSGNTLIFNSTAGGGDPDQTLSYSPTTALLTISGSGNTVQLDDLVHDSVWSGTSGTISYTMIDVDNLQVGDPLIFNAGTGITITRSTNTLTFSASGASLWTDAGTYYRPNNLSNVASNSFRIYDTGRVTIGGTSDPTPYLLSVNGIGRFTSGVSLNGNLEFTNSSNIVFDNTGSGNIVDTNGVSGTSTRILGHDGGGVAWVLKSGIDLSEFNNDIQHGYKMIRTSSDSIFALGTSYSTYDEYNSTQYDTGAMSGSTATGIITVGAAGLYHITARIMISASSVATTDKIISCISINNDAPTAAREDRVFINQPSDNGNMTINMSVTQSLSSSNTIRIKIGKVIGASGTYNVAGVSFDVFRIS